MGQLYLLNMAEVKFHSTEMSIKYKSLIFMFYKKALLLHRMIMSLEENSNDTLFNLEKFNLRKGK